MSHFAVAVIVRDIDDLESALAPYQENNGNMPKEYLEFNSQREELKRHYETWTRTMYRGNDGVLYESQNKIFEKLITPEERNTVNNYHSTEDGKLYTFDYTGFKKVEIPYNIIWESFEEYLREYCQDEWNEEANDYGYWENPNAKWDYWNLCNIENFFARYRTEDMPLGYCKIKDYKKELNQKDYDEALRFWEIIVEGQPLKEGEEKPFNLYKVEYLKERYGTKENYATIQATPHCYAFVLNGEWHEKGSMGWFGIGSDTKESELSYLHEWKAILNSPEYQDYYLAIVDCHI